METTPTEDALYKMASEITSISHSLASMIGILSMIEERLHQIASNTERIAIDGVGIHNSNEDFGAITIRERH